MPDRPRRAHAPLTTPSRLNRLRTISAALLLTFGLLAGVATPTAKALGILPESKPKASLVKDRRAVNLGVKFTTSRSGSIVALQFYRSSKQKKAYVGSIWSSKGKLLARVTFPKSSKQGWQTAKLRKPLKVKKGTYVASYLASDGNFAVVRGGYAKKRVKAGITVPKNGGVFKYSKKSKRPTSTSRSSNYLVDVVFEPAKAASSSPSPKPTTTPKPTATATPRPSPTPTPTRTPTPTPTRTSTPQPSGPLTTAQVRAAASKRVFFGHQSVGGNVMQGIDRLYQQHGLGRLRPVGLENGSAAGLPRTGAVFAHANVGRNVYPLEKLADFEKYIRSGVGSQIDVAVFKFCYVDIRGNSGNGYRTIEALFDAYASTMAALERDYPNVTFIYATVPVESAEIVGERALAANASRARYNQLVRERYSSTGRLWDLAKAESTAPDGSRVTSSYGGQRHDALYAGYTRDGGHLREVGTEIGAAPLLQVIANAD